MPARMQIRPLLIGLIADTHGLLRPQALDALRGADLIVHAGDIGDPDVLRVLKAVAPLAAIKGNNDAGAWTRSLPETKSLKVGPTRMYVIHDVKDLRFDPAARGYRVVVCGHSHRPSAVSRDGVLYVNPGSAGPRRFRLPVTVGMLRVEAHVAKAKLVELKI